MDFRSAVWSRSKGAERMSTFTLRGQRGGQTIEMIWTDGTLSGDPDAVAAVETIAQHAEGRVVSSLVDSTTHDHLSNPSSAYTLMCLVFQGVPVEIHSSGIEPYPPLPEGAVQ
jgi:hypothetical protein